MKLLINFSIELLALLLAILRQHYKAFAVYYLISIVNLFWITLKSIM